MIKPLNIKNHSSAEEILALQKEAYLVEAYLLDYYQIPPLIESLEELIASTELFLGDIEGEVCIGCIAIEETKDAMLISRLFILPENFRQGRARGLIKMAIEIATKIGKGRVRVSTGSKNKPAILLYKSMGFQFVKEEIIEPKLAISHYTLHIKP